MNPTESATDRELDQFYGHTDTPYEFTQRVNRHKRAVDADDLQDIVSANANAISAALSDGDLAEVGHIINVAYKQMVAGRVSYELYGRVGKINVMDLS